MDLNNKVVVVTGAGRGLGRAIAVNLAARGARLACVDLNEDDLRDTVARCESAGGEARSYLANVAREEAVTALFEEVVADFGGLHGLVNNAGITRDGLLVKYKDGELQSAMSLQQWQAVIDVNLTGVFLCGREAARCMLESGVEEGVIVNILHRPPRQLRADQLRRRQGRRGGHGRGLGPGTGALQHPHRGGGTGHNQHRYDRRHETGGPRPAGGRRAA